MKPSDPLLNWHINEHYGYEAINHLGNLPAYVTEADPRSAIEQINEASTFGWHTESGDEWRLTADNALVLRGHHSLPPAATATIHGETIFAYPANWVVVLHADNSFSLARIV